MDEHEVVIGGNYGPDGVQEGRIREVGTIGQSLCDRLRSQVRHERHLPLEEKRAGVARAAKVEHGVVVDEEVTIMRVLGEGIVARSPHAKPCGDA
jgi:hypothetical protein